jgi:amidase
MPPMANGGMQRGVYGRAESPYNANYLTAPFASGSSNGAGTATAASFAPSAWPKKPGPAAAARRPTTACAPTPRRAG